MNSILPSVADLQHRLKAMSAAEVAELGGASGVPVSTLMKIRGGVTPNPGIETVRKFIHLMPPESASVQAA